MIGGYNTPSIMVPEECAAAARELLAEFRETPD
jgi:hypothetical protein